MYCKVSEQDNLQGVDSSVHPPLPPGELPAGVSAVLQPPAQQPGLRRRAAVQPQRQQRAHRHAGPHDHVPPALPRGVQPQAGRSTSPPPPPRVDLSSYDTCLPTNTCFPPKSRMPWDTGFLQTHDDNESVGFIRWQPLTQRFISILLYIYFISHISFIDFTTQSPTTVVSLQTGSSPSIHICLRMKTHASLPTNEMKIRFS